MLIHLRIRLLLTPSPTSTRSLTLRVRRRLDLIEDIAVAAPSLTTRFSNRRRRPSSKDIIRMATIHRPPPLLDPVSFLPPLAAILDFSC